MKLNELWKELKKLGLTDDTELNVTITPKRSGGVKDVHIVVQPEKRTKSKLALG